jgi:5-formyltetrahydrofolate cyclo-ligase
MTTSADLPDKKTLRSQLRRARSALGATERERAAEKIVRLAVRLGLLRQGRRIGFYIPSNGEIDILPLMNRALELGVECYLPQLPSRALKKLWFTRLGEKPQHWTINRFGIPEYHDRVSKRQRIAQLDLVFVPLLGFDDQGYRIGMGGGFYDASLAFLHRRRSWRRPRLVGVAFDCQHVPAVPYDPWDVPLNLALTERRAYRFYSPR